MGLIYDDAAGRADTDAQRNGAGYLAELVIALARARFIALDELARATGPSTAELLDAVEVEALEGLDDGA
ncbi:hypothetical protein QFZ23_002116 [Arthrobacter globiformis]|uniref:hypothetical protein n=1 Tax=Arthrobacter globiformis TaxID=1665 RepID=UPI00277DB379|nr:hypothetical protein [Arthrobacter globiformis]MDQ1058215.1 hypothetical protein [Arthrobacter globiformis]